VILRLARGLSNPARLLRSALVRLRLPVSTEVKLELDLYDRPNYAFGLHRAALQARALQLPAISGLEFGVGTGEGLLALERVAAEVEALTGVRIRLFGFDLGAGLPEPRDYRDLPYLYRGGFYRLDEARLRRRLTRAELILGDVADTVPAFLDGLDDLTCPPIGFVAFDLDYYSSTVAGLRVFEGDPSRCLPRVLCYFDDIANLDALQCEYTGELLAIHEFNRDHPDAKIAAITGFTASRIIPDVWNEKIMVCHLFRHPLYNRHILAQAEHYVPPIG
jgi:hypothetical protein